MSMDIVWTEDQGFLKSYATITLESIIGNVVKKCTEFKPYLVPKIQQNLHKALGRQSIIYVQTKKSQRLANQEDLERMFEKAFYETQSNETIYSTSQRRLEVKHESLENVIQRIRAQIQDTLSKESAKYYKVMLEYEIAQWEWETIQVFAKFTTLKDQQAPKTIKAAFLNEWKEAEKALALIVKDLFDPENSIDDGQRLEGVIDWARGITNQLASPNLRILYHLMLDMFDEFKTVKEIQEELTTNPRKDGVWLVLTEAAETFLERWKGTESRIVDVIQKMFDRLVHEIQEKENKSNAGPPTKKQKLSGGGKANHTKPEPKDFPDAIRDEAKPIRSSRRGVHKMSAEEQWLYLHNILRSYRDCFYNCHVPLDYRLNGEDLGQWVKEQCTAKRRGRLSKEQIEKLNELDFDFDWSRDDGDENEASNPISVAEKESESQIDDTSASSKSSKDAGAGTEDTDDSSEIQDEASPGGEEIDADMDDDGWTNLEVEYLRSLVKKREGINDDKDEGFWDFLSKHCFKTNRSATSIQKKWKKVERMDSVSRASVAKRTNDKTISAVDAKDHDSVYSSDESVDHVEKINRISFDRSTDSHTIAPTDWDPEETHYYVRIMEFRDRITKPPGWTLWDTLAHYYFDGYRPSKSLQSKWRKIRIAKLDQLKRDDPAKFCSLMPPIKDPVKLANIRELASRIKWRSISRGSSLPKSPKVRRHPSPARRRRPDVSFSDLCSDHGNIWGLVPRWSSEDIKTLEGCIEYEVRKGKYDIRCFEFWKSIASSNFSGKYDARTLFQRWRYHT